MRILVSRNLAGVSLLRNWCQEKGYELIEAPFIRIDPVLNVEIPDTDWVFFSSPNGLDVYFNNYPLLAEKIGVYGKGTQMRLAARGIEANFTGDTSKTPSEIGAEFFDFIGAKAKVLFPQSQLSKKSIANANPGNDCIIKVVYNTSLEAHHEVGIDIAILTSPSNIDGFLLENTTENIKFIVLGETSKNHFEKLGLTDQIFVPKSADEAAVILLLEEMLSQ